MIRSFTRYLLRVLIALDLLANALIGGKLGETLSGSAWRGEQAGLILPTFFRPIIDRIFSPWGPDHCKEAAAADAIRRDV